MIKYQDKGVIDEKMLIELVTSISKYASISRFIIQINYTLKRT